jgi:LPS sulfotransferase NodH
MSASATRRLRGRHCAKRPSPMKQHFLYSSEFDFPQRQEPPSKIVTLLFVPRCGSTLLACLMAQTKVLGFPLEYFAEVNLAVMSARLPGLSTTRFDPLVSVRTSTNGVFSYKWNPDYEKMQSLAEIKRTLQPDCFIIMDRDDKDAQARSLAIAQRTNAWVLPKSEDRSAPPPIPSQIVEQNRLTLASCKTQIYSIVESSRLPFMELSYETLLANPQGTVESIGTFCGTKVENAVSLDQVPIAKQSGNFR